MKKIACMAALIVIISIVGFKYYQHTQEDSPDKRYYVYNKNYQHWSGRTYILIADKETNELLIEDKNGTRKLLTDKDGNVVLDNYNWKKHNNIKILEK